MTINYPANQTIKQADRAHMLSICGGRALASSVPGNGFLLKQVRNGAAFESVRADGIQQFLEGDCNLLTVVVKTSKTHSIRVEAESNLISHIRTNFLGSTLNISLATKIRPTRPILITASRPRTASKGSASPSPFVMRGLACSADFTLKFPKRQ